MTCLPCEKEIIDNGMGVYAAQFYKDVRTGTPADVAAASFYQATLTNIFAPLGKSWLALSGKDQLSKEQTAKLEAQINKECYRADALIAWSGTLAAQATTDHWAATILGWAKDNQTFYTAFSTELGGKQHDG